MTGTTTDNQTSDAQANPLFGLLGEIKTKKSQAPKEAIDVVQDRLYKDAVNKHADNLSRALAAYEAAKKEFDISCKKGDSVYECIDGEDKVVGKSRTPEHKKATDEARKKMNNLEKAINESLLPDENGRYNFSKLENIK